MVPKIAVDEVIKIQILPSILRTSMLSKQMCGIYENKIIGHLFSRIFECRTLFALLENKLNDFLDNILLLQPQQIWFQQDCAPCHSRLTLRQSIKSL